MGQAKQRGSLEERKASALEKQAQEAREWKVRDSLRKKNEALYPDRRGNNNLAAMLNIIAGDKTHRNF